MYLLALLQIFPPEIVKIIYMLCHEYSINKINNFISKKRFDDKIISSTVDGLSCRYWNSVGIFINYLGNNEDTTIQWNFCDEEYNSKIKCMPNKLYYILDNNFSRKKYSHDFWKHFLNSVSKKIMTINNNLMLSNIATKNYIQYSNLLGVIDAWFKLCVLHNIKLYIGIKKPFKTEYIESYAKDLNRIKNFKKFSFPPHVIFENEKIFDEETSNNYLVKYLHKRRI